MESSCGDVILGLWPIAGITSGAVPRADGLATIQAAIDHGVTWFDTAFAYGYDGESDRLLGEVLNRPQNRGKELKVIGKVGQRWTSDRARIADGRPEQLLADAKLSLQRLGIDAFDLLMLHCVDPAVELQRSAEALVMMQSQGLAKQLGVCNVNAEQLVKFAEVAPCRAVQCPLNLLQRESLQQLIPTAQQHGIRCDVFWVLMKGIFAGQIKPDHQFDPDDRRPSYEIYQGQWRQRAQRLVDGFESLAERYQTTVARLSIGWALSQPGVTHALVGAKRPGQIIETAASRRLQPEVLEQIERLVAELYSVESK